MSIIDLSFMQRYTGKLNTAIKDYVGSKNPNEKGTSIASGTNLNDMNTVGVYYIQDDTVAGTIINLPLAVCGKILVSDNGNNGMVQFFIPNHSTRLFQRNYWSNSWTAWKEYGEKSILLSQTLTAGETSVTFTSSEITATVLIDVYTSVAGLAYQSMTGSVGSVTVTYEEQASDITVTLEIKKQ